MAVFSIQIARKLTMDLLLPTTVLDLTSPGEDSDIRLTINQGGCHRGKYASLSHRWGQGTKPLTSTTKNINSNCSQIRFNELPVAFQDEVRICRRLSISYLWIDSLCIVQDSAEDWVEEASKMADLYAEAFITIALSSAWDSHHPILTAGPRVPHVRLAGQLSHVYLRGMEDENLEQFWGDTVEGKDCTRSFAATTGRLAPLGSRAWAYQDRLLSRRVLYFTPRQLVWQCRGIVLLESTIVPACETHGLMPASKSYPSHKDAINAWYNAIWFYSRLELTYTSDKLVAFSAVARCFAGVLQDDYAAGLWKRDLHTLLLWRRTENQIPRPNAYRAPSWSWASVDGGVAWTEGPTTHVLAGTHPRDVCIVDVNVENVSADKFGAV
jgi:hypothetical protein